MYVGKGGTPFFDFPDGYGGVDKVNIAVGTHGGTGNIFVGFDVFDKGLGEMRDGPDLTANILKPPSFVATIDVERCRDGDIDFLVRNGLGQLTGDVLRCESRLYPLLRFDEARFEEVCKDGVEFYRDRAGLTEKRREAGREGIEPLESLKEQARNRVGEKTLSRSSPCPVKLHQTER